ncbi:transcriptional regulator [Pseudoxanthomonas sp. GM95]|uniref:type III pantothenate kinase n=1 Tax=Pseudoxanthomonas sp. GM95 TaxID=1881043 RepID=UPI0008C163CB|nr:type III pantothenate kinase [Pseudoxanthomonas sp. GM95]SEK38418.1 transcriptional regulator [Pseudoxanthomonas sp. GM95]
MTAEPERWLFDLGNTRLKCARVQADGRPGPVIAFGNGQGDLLQGLAAQLPPSGLSACLASVAAPALTAGVLEVLQARFRVVSLARTQASLAGLQVAYAEPARLGVDRFLAMLGARTHGTGPWLVAGVGTALTIDAIAEDGRHLGGRIAPSPQLMRQALHRAAAQLPADGGLFDEFACDTPDALASGCEGAAVALIERSLVQATAALGATPGLLLHGGGIETLLPLLPQARRVDGLVLEGLAVWSGAQAGVVAAAR